MDMLCIGTAVVGTGAAGYNAALRLSEMGEENVAIVTEGILNSTSRNTGSDKQTYYKLGLAGNTPDSPTDMAHDLFAPGCVDGDHAYAEAALSTQCFYHLLELGVPFPVNRYGEPIGYRTDHDTRGRATSAGPLTSKLMTECLQAAVDARGIRVFDHCQVVRILPFGGDAIGLILLDTASQDVQSRFKLACCKNVVWATGGPAGIYADSVYPLGHTGSTGAALAAGAKAKNLTEWQYGLASVAPRWNVSGTYMQVLPRFVSVDPDGTEHEFLSEYFDNVGEMLSRVFRKGYEWPFDCRRARDGSSVIDLLVYRETKLRGRRVYLDFRKNPCGLDNLPYTDLSDDARSYLEAAGACFGTPLERLAHMNQPAIDLYASRGVDLSKEMLEIALCAQHNNGGLDVDLWWQTSVPGLFCAGEAAGTHGIYRPGGSALNAGQVGSLRAAQYITRKRPGVPDAQRTLAVFHALEAGLKQEKAFCQAVFGEQDNTQALLDERRAAMSECAGAIRNVARMREMIEENRKMLADLSSLVRASGTLGLARAYMLRDTLITQIAVLTAMAEYAKVGASRGSAIYTDPDGSAAPGLEAEAGGLFRYRSNGDIRQGEAQVVSFDPDTMTAASEFRPVRPLPEGGGFFENVWRRYREDGNVF